MDYNSADSSDLTFDLDNFHLHTKYSHGCSELVCSGLVCCCWVGSCNFYSHSGTKLLQSGMDLLKQALGQQHFSAQHYLQFPLH